MKLRVLVSLGMFSFLTGCTAVSSFEGKIHEMGQGHFLVDCSESVNHDRKKVKDIGYLCEVQVTDTTVLQDQSGQSLTAEAFTEGAVVRVVLAKPHRISTSKKSREIEAKEIILQ